MKELELVDNEDDFFTGIPEALKFKRRGGAKDGSKRST